MWDVRGGKSAVSILDWFRRKKRKIEKPLPTMEPVTTETKEKVEPRAKEAEVKGKARRKSRKRRKKSASYDS